MMHPKTGRTLFYNARFYSLQQVKVFDWLLVANGRIIALGKNDDMPSISRRTNLEGKTVIPSFTDSHTHFAMTALYNERIQLNSAQSLHEVLRLIQDSTQNHKSGQWLLGAGYDKNIWPDGSPHKKHLDKIIPDRPVFIESKDCHTVWVNTKALALAKIDSTTPDPPGGKIGRDEDSSPNGLLYENAQKFVRNIIPVPSGQEIADSIENNLKRFHSKGITTVHTMEGIEEFKAFQFLNRQKKLNMRITIYLPQSNLEILIQSGLCSGFGNEWLRIGGIKFFVDGSLGSQTAEMLEPYEGSQNYGVANMSAKELNERLALSLQNGLSAAVHAIGDRSLIKALDAFEKAETENENILPSRIEHAQLIPGDQFKRFKKLSLIASVQPSHIADDVHIAQKYWGKRTENAYPFNHLIKQGITLAFGSDTPVADFDPIAGIYAAVHRKYKMRNDEPAWHPEQCITVKEAVQAYTIGGAIAGGELAYKGTLAPGKLADFIVLNKDIFTIPADDILQVKVLKTFLNGRVVFEQ